MNKSTWKKGESRVAAFFGSTRTPLSGGNSKITRSDSMHPTLFIETKHRARHAVRTLYDEAAKQAKAEGKTPMVCLIDKNRHGFLIVVHSGEWGRAGGDFRSHMRGAAGAGADSAGDPDVEEA